MLSLLACHDDGNSTSFILQQVRRVEFEAYIFAWRSGVPVIACVACVMSVRETNQFNQVNGLEIPMRTNYCPSSCR